MPLAPPPLDAKGNVLPHDAPDINDGDVLIRRISNHYIITNRHGQRRISSMAFKPSTAGAYPGMSIDLEAQIIEAGVDPALFVTTPVYTGSVSWTAGPVRALGLQVGSHPLLPDNPYHGEVWGITGRAQQRALQAMAVWYVPISGVAIAPA